MYFVYIIRSLKSGIIYVGMAKDVNIRLDEHNSGKSKFTKGHLPFNLIYQEGPYETKQARIREKQLKQTDIKNRILSNL
jgi:putative endonuclease